MQKRAAAVLAVSSIGLGLHACTRPSETICQDNPDVVFCDDMETGDDSNWGHPPAFDLFNPGASTERPFAGKYSMKFAYGELSSPSYQFGSFPRGTSEIWIRLYFYADPLFHWGVGSGVDHTFSISSAGGTTCTGSPGGLDWGPLDALIYRPGTESCMDRVDLPLNMGTAEDRIIRNGKWYRIEYHLKLNTVGGCTDKNNNGRFDALGDCDGVNEVWYDGKQVLGYYTVNHRSNDEAYYIDGFLYNHYYRVGGQTYHGKGFAEYRDNLVIIEGPNGGTPIGPIPDEPSLGTPDPVSPYNTQVYKDWVAFDASGMRIRPGADCANSMMTQDFSSNWWDGGGGVSFVSSPAHNAPLQTHCTATGGDKSLRVQTSSAHQFAGDGVGLPRGFPNKSYVLNHWIYLDPTAFPAANGAALSGLFSYGAGDARNYAAVGVDASNHPQLILQTRAGAAAPQILATNSNTVISTGSWHQIELRGSEDHDWSVLLDGKEIISLSNVSDSAFWSFTDLTYHFGISDHMSNGSMLIAYVDEMSAGNTSFQDCFGWNPSICPFSGSP